MVIIVDFIAAGVPVIAIKFCSFYNTSHQIITYNKSKFDNYFTYRSHGRLNCHFPFCHKFFLRWNLFQVLICSYHPFRLETVRHHKNHEIFEPAADVIFKKNEVLIFFLNFQFGIFKIITKTWPSFCKNSGVSGKYLNIARNKIGIKTKIII